MLRTAEQLASILSNHCFFTTHAAALERARSATLLHCEWTACPVHLEAPLRHCVSPIDQITPNRKLNTQQQYNTMHRVTTESSRWPTFQWDLLTNNLFKEKKKKNKARTPFKKCLKYKTQQESIHAKDNITLEQGAFSSCSISSHQTSPLPPPERWVLAHSCNRNKSNLITYAKLLWWFCGNSTFVIL